MHASLNLGRRGIVPEARGTHDEMCHAGILVVVGPGEEDIALGVDHGDGGDGRLRSLPLLADPVLVEGGSEEEKSIRAGLGVLVILVFIFILVLILIFIFTPILVSVIVIVVIRVIIIVPIISHVARWITWI